MIKVSVLTAAYKAEKFIARPARSLLQQTFQRWEWIIASDDRVDYREALAAQGIVDPRIRSVSTGEIGAGPARARNAALDAASGDVMAVMDDDDALAPDKLELLVNKALEYGVVTSNIRVIEESTGRFYSSLNARFPRGLIGPMEYMAANLHTYSVLVWDARRAQLRWPEHRFLMEDLLLGLGAFDFVQGIYYEPSPLHDYYKRTNSVTTSPASCAHYLSACETLLAMKRAGELKLRNKAALAALDQFLLEMIGLERAYAAEAEAEAPMQFYHFLERRRSGFFEALNVRDGQFFCYAQEA